MSDTQEEEQSESTSGSNTNIADTTQEVEVEVDVEDVNDIIIDDDEDQDQDQENEDTNNADTQEPEPEAEAEDNNNDNNEVEIKAPNDELIIDEDDDEEDEDEEKDENNDALLDLGQLVMACRDLAKRSGHVIKTIFESGDLRVVDKAFDGRKQLKSLTEVLAVQDPTTIADELAQKMIVGSLQKQFPLLRVNGEEGDLAIADSDIIIPNTKFDKKVPEKYANIKIEDVVVWVDPIDGTKEFTEGIKSAVTTLIGICWKGRPIAGIIGRPFSDQVVWAIVGLGAFGFNSDISLQNRDHNRRIIVTTRSHFKPRMKAYVSACAPTSFKRVGGCGSKVLMVIEGECDAYVFPSLGTKKWDTAAPEAILLSLGGRLTRLDGSLYDYEPTRCKAMNQEGLIATVFDKAYHDSFLEQNLVMNQLDLILFGATGFTGKLAAKFIAEQYFSNENNNGNNNGGNDDDDDDKRRPLKIGLAGRSLKKLENLVENELLRIDENAREHFELIQCNSFSTSEVETMASRTSCIITTVGPYARYGEPLIAACCKYGVDYVDLTGEYFWVRRMINKYDAEAKRSSARIVNFGGFISALTDCCVYSAVQHLTREKGYNETADNGVAIQHAVKGMGSQSGGTVESTFNAVANAVSSTNAYYLKPGSCGFGPKQPQVPWPVWNETYKCYETPFMFYALIERMVFVRSNMLLDYAYGKQARFYTSVLLLKSMILAWIIALVVSVVPGLAKYAICRWFISKLRRFMPKPGEGPTEEVMFKSHWKQYINVRSRKRPKEVSVTVEVDVYGDYGYLNTAKLLVEQGMLFSEQRANSKVRKIRGGFLTPAVAFGDSLVPRLNRLKEFNIEFKDYSGRI